MYAGLSTYLIQFHLLFKIPTFASDAYQHKYNSDEDEGPILILPVHKKVRYIFHRQRARKNDDQKCAKKC